MKIEKYSTRSWVLRDEDGSMVAVFLYKKGAEHVKNLILNLRGANNGDTTV